MVVGQFEGNFPQCHHDELSTLAALTAHLCDSFCIVGVKVLVNLIEVVKRTWVIILNREDEREGGH